MTSESAEQAFNLYGDTVLRLAIARTGSKSDGEDILQEVFIRYMRLAHGFQSEEHRKHWFIRTTVNCSKSLRMSAWKTKHVIADVGVPLEDMLEEKSHVYYAVLSLPVKYRTAVHLFYYEELSTREIADAMDCAEGTVRSLLNRARKKLEELLKGADFDV